jgi:hypothetical protein
VAVVGRASGTRICELLGECGQVDASVMSARNTYELGLRAYLGRDFGQAGELFRLAGAARPDDKVATVLAIRADELLRDPPPTDWDDTYYAVAK